MEVFYDPVRRPLDMLGLYELDSVHTTAITAAWAPHQPRSAQYHFEEGSYNGGPTLSETA